MPRQRPWATRTEEDRQWARPRCSRSVAAGSAAPPCWRRSPARRWASCWSTSHRCRCWSSASASAPARFGIRRRRGPGGGARVRRLRRRRPLTAACTSSRPGCIVQQALRPSASSPDGWRPIGDVLATLTLLDRLRRRHYCWAGRGDEGIEAEVRALAGRGRRDGEPGPRARRINRRWPISWRRSSSASRRSPGC